MARIPPSTLSQTLTAPLDTASPVTGNPARPSRCTFVSLISCAFVVRSLASLFVPATPSFMPHAPLHLSSLVPPRARARARAPYHLHVCTIFFRRTYFVPPNLPPLPCQSVKLVQTLSCRCHFRGPRSYSARVPSCPYYCRSPTKMKRGFLRRPGITPTGNNSSTTYLCLFNRYLTYGRPWLPLYTPRGFTNLLEPFYGVFVISRAHKRSPTLSWILYLGFSTPMTSLRRCVTGTYISIFLTLQAVTKNFLSAYRPPSYDKS